MPIEKLNGLDLNVFGPLVILRLQTLVSVVNQYCQVNPIVLNIVKWLTRHLVMDKKNNLTLRKSYNEFCWDVEKVTDFTSMFEGATNFRGKVHSWTLNSLATIQNGSFVDMFKNSGLAGANAGIDLFQQKFTQTPSEEEFGYRFLEKDAGLVAWDPATGLPTGAYNRSMRSTNDELRSNFDPVSGVSDPFTTSSGIVI